MYPSKSTHATKHPSATGRENGHLVPVSTLEVAHTERLDRVIIGASKAMRGLKELLSLAADCHSTVLVTGESGTGKELVARTIHDLSVRAAHPFIPLNCAALPETLLEAELFGYERGAFTGAHARKDGLFVAAHGGTIFLDELGETSAGVQTKLLRVLQERAVRPVGSHREQKFDVRVILATNRDLAREVREGRFREDLYYRVNVLPVHLPPLRERLSDIPRLIEHFLANQSHRARDGEQQQRRRPLSIEPQGVLLLCQHDWPGNIRELHNVLERLTLMAGREPRVTAGQVSATLRLSKTNGHLHEWPPERLLARGLSCLKGASVDCAKHEMIEAALIVSRGNQAQAASMLGMKRAAFHRLRKRVAARAAAAAAEAAGRTSASDVPQ